MTILALMIAIAAGPSVDTDHTPIAQASLPPILP